MRLRIRNIGPAAGEHDLGELDGPGWYNLVSANAGGKSSLLSLLGRLAQGGSLAKVVNVTDGESRAELELSPAKLTFTCSPSGQVTERREGIGALAAISELPGEIGTLRDGDGLLGDEPRKRARLAALLRWCSIPASEEKLDLMLGELAESPWAQASDFVSAWGGLVARAADSAKRLRQAPLMDLQGLRLLLGPHTSGDLLALQDALVDALNACANAGEKAAEVAGRDVAAASGEVASVMEGLVSWSGMEAGIIRQRMAELRPAEVIVQELRAVRERVAALTATAAERAAEEKRREGLRRMHGERPLPDVERERVNALELAATEARARCVTAAAASNEASAQRSVLSERGLGLRREQTANQASWEARFSEAQRALHGASLDVFGRCLAEMNEQGAALLQARRATEEAYSRLREHEERVNAAVAEVDAADAAEVEILKEVQAAKNALVAREREVQAWVAVDAELGEPLPTAEPGNLERAQDRVRELEVEERLAHEARRYAAASAKLAEAEAVAVRVESLAKSYRASARESWGALGALVTEEISLPWLQLDGLDIHLGYVGGQLNNDPAVVAQAEAVARAEAGTLSRIALARFVQQRVRAITSVEWRSLDSEERISSGELAEAALAIMLHRRDALGAICLVPWDVTAAFDGERMARMAGRVADAGLIVLSERPSRGTESRELHLEKVSRDV